MILFPSHGLPGQVLIGGGGMPRVKMPRVMAAKQARTIRCINRDGEVVIKTAQDSSKSK